VTLAGEWDLARQEELRELLRPLTGSLTVDLREVTYLDSSAISVFVETRNRLLSAHGGMNLRVRQGDFVRRTLEVIGLADWIVN
jgi:anti-anti-sigma factor